MRFGIFYEHQLPRPWAEGAELKLFQDALDQVELADRLGFDNVWEVEHHFLEEYSHSSAPWRCSSPPAPSAPSRSGSGHGIVLMPPSYNHPGRGSPSVSPPSIWSPAVASNGAPAKARPCLSWAATACRWRREAQRLARGGGAVRQHDGDGPLCRVSRASISPCVYPQHRPQAGAEAAPAAVGRLLPTARRSSSPRAWGSGRPPSPSSIRPRRGSGSTTTIASWARRCPSYIGHAVNANIAMVSSFGVHHDLEEARRRFQDGFRFFQFALGWHYGFGEQIPGRTDIWSLFEKAKASMPRRSPRPRAASPPLRVCAPTCASSPIAGSIRSPSSSRAGAIATSTSARRWSCSPPR